VPNITIPEDPGSVLARLQGNVFCDDHHDVPMVGALGVFKVTTREARLDVPELKFTCKECKRFYDPTLGYFPEKADRPKCKTHGLFLFFSRDGSLACPFERCRSLK